VRHSSFRLTCVLRVCALHVLSKAVARAMPSFWGKEKLAELQVSVANCVLRVPFTAYEKDDFTQNTHARNAFLALPAHVISRSNVLYIFFIFFSLLIQPHASPLPSPP